jgi:hypothetical protein
MVKNLTKMSFTQNQDEEEKHKKELGTTKTPVDSDDKKSNIYKSMSNIVK